MTKTTNVNLIDITTIPYYNEACAICGQSADLHCGDHVFVRFDPPKAAYATEWWEGGEKLKEYQQQCKEEAKKANDLIMYDEAVERQKEADARSVERWGCRCGTPPEDQMDPGAHSGWCPVALADQIRRQD